MLKKTFFFSILGLLIAISLFLTKFLYVRESDIIEFNNIEQKNLEFDSTKAYQKRENVQKDLYVIDKNTRKHYQISSKVSEIFLNRTNQKYELIENLHNITFLCFEDILDTQMMQHIKYITADYGSYIFPSHKFNLFDVNLSFMNTLNFNKTSFDQASLDQTNISNSHNVYFQGKAKELDFSIYKNKPEIKAILFTGSFNPKKCVKCEK